MIQGPPKQLYQFYFYLNPEIPLSPLNQNPTSQFSKLINPRTIFSKSHMHGSSPGSPLLQTSFKIHESDSSFWSPDKTQVQMAPKCPVLPPYRPENQAQVLPTCLAQVGLVLPSGFLTKIRNSTGFIKGWTEI